MKNPKRVAELLAQLKGECESKAELVAVNRLETVLTNIANPNHVQFFNGYSYYQTKSGYYLNRRNYECHQLHRDVWIYYNGAIPDGYVVHHIDLNPANNSIDNLKLMEQGEHSRLHRNLKHIIAICEVCGKEFKTIRKGVRYCSQPCRVKAGYERTKIERVCPVCGKKFMSPKNPPSTCCSMKCSHVFRRHSNNPAR